MVLVDFIPDFFEVTEESSTGFDVARGGPVIGRGVACHVLLAVKVLLLEGMLDLLADVLFLPLEVFKLSLNASVDVRVDQRLALGGGLCGLEVVGELVDDIWSELGESCEEEDRRT